MTLTSKYKIQSLRKVQISNSLHHERIMLAPLSHSEATTLAVGLRRCLLKGFEGTCFSTLKIKHPWLAKKEKKCHEYLALPGIRETVRDIMMNLSSVVLVGVPVKNKTALLRTSNEIGIFEAKHLILPENVYCLSPNQPILTAVVPLELELELTIEKGSGFRIRDGGEHQEEGLLLDARFNPILQVDYQIQRAERRAKHYKKDKISFYQEENISYKTYTKNSSSSSEEQAKDKTSEIQNSEEQAKDKTSETQNALDLHVQDEDEQDNFCLLLFDIWTNGTIQPMEAMQRAARQAIAIYVPLLRFTPVMSQSVNG